MKFLNHKEYRIFSNIEEETAKFLFDAIFSKSYQTILEYKNDESSFVSRIKIKDFEDMIFKIPRNRNSRLWEIFLTLFRESDSFRVAQSLKIANEAGLNSPSLIFAAQKRKFFVVIDSFFVYKFVEGREVMDSDLPKILRSLQILHSKGYIRSDPKIENFLMKEDKVYFIDFRLKKPIVFKKLFIMENLCKFIKTDKKLIGLLNENLKNSILYKTACFLSEIKSNCKKIRRNIKSKLCNILD